VLEEKLKNIIHKQKDLIAELEHETFLIAKNDLLQENERIKGELLKLKRDFENQKEENRKMKEENIHFKSALYEHIYNEKIAILNAVNHKVDAYYNDTLNREKNRLLAFEKTAKENIQQMFRMLREHRVSAEDEIFSKIEALKGLLDQKLTVALAELESKEGSFSKDREFQLNALHSENLTEQEMKSAMKKNNIENFIGLNIINKVGILFLIIGVITASRYTYFQLGDSLKSIFMFLLGGGFFAAGEFLNRKKSDVFSLGITSAGVAILYVALGISYFGLGVLTMIPALILCIGITLVSFIFSIRYHSQTIATFALVGGYLPIFSMAGNQGMVYSGMAYFIVLSIFALSISVKNKWSVSQFVGFFLNFIATIYIVNLMLGFRSLEAKFGMKDFILLAYLSFAYVVYTLIPIVSTYFEKENFKKPDIILLGFNTFLSSIVMYGIFYEVGLKDFTGLLAISFAAIYLLLGRFIETRMIQERNVKVLFYLTGFTFGVLIIPFQFGRVWLSLGWLVEGVVLASYGIFKEEKNFKKGGFLIFAFSVFSFLIWDVLLRVSPELFAYKYFAITLGSVIILYALGAKKTLSESIMKAFKIAVVVNLWVFARYMIGFKLRGYLNNQYANTRFNIDYWVSSFNTVVDFLIGYTVVRIKVLSDYSIKVIGMSIYILGILSIFTLNATSPFMGRGETIPLLIIILGTIALLAINFLAVLALRDFLQFIVLERRLGIEWYPLILSGFFMLLLSQNLITQVGLEFNNAIISILYVIASFSWVIYGFLKRYVFIRRFGLGLSMIAVAKLFILDISVLQTQGIKILSYFAFGVILMAISFVYQYYSKKLESMGGLLPKDKKQNEKWDG
jgi:hypothetical protein